MLKWLHNLVGGKTAASEENAPPPFQVTAEQTTAAASNRLPIVRQLILNRENQIIGYDFSLRGQGRNNAHTDPHSQVIHDESLIHALHDLGVDRIAQFRELWLSIYETSLGNPLLDNLPAKSTVILIRPSNNDTANDEALEQIKKLQGKGLRIGLLGYPNTPFITAWLSVIDLLAIEINTYTPKELQETLLNLREKYPTLKIIARRADSYEEYEYCHQLGFDAFSGQFLLRRENWPPQAALHPDRIRVVELLNQLREGGELSDVSEKLRTLPELSYRFLRYINSAGMGLPSHIASIDQGVMYLGREKLYRWLTLLLFSSHDGRPTDSALLEQSLVRGRMMELLAQNKLPRLQCDELFIIGIFSLFDVLLRMPMSLAIEPLQLPAAAAEALNKGTGIYAPYLKLAIAHEQDEETNNSDETNAALTEWAAPLGLSIEQLSSQHLQALNWAQQLNSSAL